MKSNRSSKIQSFIKKIAIAFFIVGFILVGLYLILPTFANPLPSFFYSITYLGFILVSLGIVFSMLLLLQIESFIVYIAFVWLNSGIFILVLNRLVFMRSFSEIFLKTFNPLYGILFCAIGITLLMIEIIRHLYLKPPKMP